MKTRDKIMYAIVFVLAVTCIVLNIISENWSAVCGWVSASVWIGLTCLYDTMKIDKEFKDIRLEVIDDYGRQYTEYNMDINFSVQDDGRTLKIFAEKNEEAKDE